MTLEHLAERSEREQMLLSRADAALGDGRITQAEYEFYVNKVLAKRAAEPTTAHGASKEYGSSTRTLTQKQSLGEPVTFSSEQTLDERKITTGTKALGVFLAIAFVFGLLWAFSGVENPTGFVALEPTAQLTDAMDLLITNSTTIPIEHSGTGISVSGELRGSAKITFIANGTEYLVYEGAAVLDEYMVLTEKTSYAQNQTVTIEVVPATDYTLWLSVGEGRVLIGEELFVTDPGEYTIDALFNDSGAVALASTTFVVRNDTNSSFDTERERERPVVLTKECGEACAVNYEEGVLSFVVDGELLLEEIGYAVARSNTAPAQTTDLPTVELAVGETQQLSLGNYFTDADDDEMVYDYMNAAGVQMEIVGNVLSITGVTVGESESLIYATDLYELTQSETFTIIVTESDTQLEGTTPNITETPTETIQPVNTSTPNTTLPSTLDCSNADPNMRSPECFIGVEADYFKQQDGFTIENKARTGVARLNAIGNLLLTGEVIENSAGMPGAQDFSVGYNDDFEFMATAWIDSEGNLHLRGNAYEEQISLAVPPRTYSFQSRKGINLGYIDTRTGDLYIRGNVIPYRRSIE